MMDLQHVLLALWFLPLFPFSGLFVYLVGRLIRWPLVRAALFVAWPVIGVLVLGHDVPGWMRLWALFSALLYALRLMTMRDLRLWGAYLGASSYALLWLPDAGHAPGWQAALALGIPLAFLALVTGMLEKRFGAAYSGLYGGLHLRQRRLAGLLTAVTLAAVAAPIFPGFFVLTGIAFHTGLGYAVGSLLTWVLWGWSAALLLQGFMLGPPRAAPDVGTTGTAVSAAMLAILVGAGLISISALLLGG